MNKIAKPIVHQKAIIGEGALWDHTKKLLYWVDILGQKVFIYDPKTNENREFLVGHDVGTVVPRRSGGLMLAVRDGFASLNTETGEVKILKDTEADIPTNRFNDGKCDPAGRFWAGTMGYDWLKPASGSVYILHADLSVRKVIEPVGCSNGLVWTRDGKTMYYIDSMTWEIHRYDYDVNSGDISNKRVAVSIAKEIGLPDGMAIDENDNLWVAMYGGGAVCCWNPKTGELLETIDVPGARLVTSCAFGGENLTDLYITTGNNGLSEEERKQQPNCGALFKVELKVKGTPAHFFQG
ncbi:MAG: SMP-30/gluconolactonase/LRE family protein [Terrimicrobiaceae bacterium]